VHTGRSVFVMAAGVLLAVVAVTTVVTGLTHGWANGLGTGWLGLTNTVTLLWIIAFQGRPGFGAHPWRAGASGFAVTLVAVSTTGPISILVGGFPLGWLTILGWEAIALALALAYGGAMLASSRSAARAARTAA
jgi:hypothetical protein